MKDTLFRSTLIAMTLAAAVVWIVPARATERTPQPAHPSIDLSGKRGFDFLDGEWRVHHRRISSVTRKWVEFGGTCSHRLLMAGWANVEEYALDSPDGAYRALNLRAYDEKTGLWSIWWLDQRYPEGPLGSPVQGRFENGIGTFYGDYHQNGKPMRVRFIWSDMTPTSARWQQATSADGGKTWQANWYMELQRSQLTSAQSSGQKKRREFEFLQGDWQVQHRYIRAQADRREWVEAPGTVSHHEYHEGWANVEDYVMGPPDSRHYAVAMRSYNPKNAQWTIWWLDGRDPSRIEDPMKGRFENGVGTFYGTLTLKGQPTPARFIWSDTTTASPRWQQAYSYDGGKTWETVWTMQFRRGSAEPARMPLPTRHPHQVLGFSAR